MKVIILAGGFGTRIGEETHLRPKPMIEIGGKPILWHIMKEYSYYGFNDFIICAGYMQHVIKQWFSDYYLYNSDVTFDFTEHNKMVVHNNLSEPWKVTIIDTGLNTMTGGRLKRIQPYVGDETFMFTYGDGVSDVNIKELVEFHRQHGKIATITAVNVGQQFGVLEINHDNMITRFREKNDSDGSVINAGYMVLQPEIFNYLSDDTEIFEQKPLQTLAVEGQLKAYLHDGFWKCMDTQRDKMKLEALIAQKKAPWMAWEK